MTRTLILPGLHDSDPRHWQSRWEARDDGRGEFFSQETLNGRAILVRFVISDITPDSCRFEQAFSDDGGKNWEVNWIAMDTRVKGEA
jgi:hypothetical protein